MQKKHMSTMLRLVFSLLSVFLIPIIFLYITFTFRVVGTVKTELEDIVVSDVKYAINQINTKIEALDNAVEMFQRGNGYQSYLTRSFDNDSSGNSAINFISSDISYIYLLSEIADDFVVALPDYDTMFSSSGMQTSENYLTKNFVTTQYDEDYLRDLFFHSNTKQTILIDNLVTRRGNGEHLVFVYPLSKTIEGKGANAIFSIPMYRISSILSLQSENFDVQTVVLNETGNLLFSHNISEDSLNDFLANGINQKELSVDGRKCKINKTVSDVNGWSYYTLIPQDFSLVNQTFKLNQFFLIYTTMVLLVGAAIIYLFFKLNYSPIKALRDKTKDIMGDEDGNSDELQIIDTALTKLKDSARQSLSEIRNNRLMRLITGYYYSLDEYNKDCEQINLSFSSDYFAISILQFKDSDKFDDSIIATLREILSSSGECEFSYISKHHRLVIIHCLKNEEALDVSFFATVLGVLNDSFSLTPVIGIGRVHKGTDMIEKSYIQADSAISFISVNPTRKIIHYNEVLNYYVSEHVLYPNNEMKQLSSAVNYLDFQRAVSILDTLKEIVKNPSTSMLTARWICFDMLKTLASNSHLTHNGSFKVTEMLSQLVNESNRNNIRKMIDYISDNIRNIFCSDSSDSDSSDLIDDMIEYIKQNYCRYDFSVQEIADKFQIGLGAAGQLFKENTNRGLLEYVIDMRIEKAKELLASTNKAVKEISYEVGYLNVTSFIRRFKDYEGLSPNEYRFKNV